jgi:hypothetical protein
MAGLSFVTLLAYDWKYAFEAIRSYYAIADEIILGLDTDRISWSKKPFVFDDQAVAEFIAAIDTDKKIRILEGNFHAHEAPIDNDTSERRQLGAACRAGNWVVQIDADEILLNPLELVNYLNAIPHDVDAWGSWLPVYKIIGNKALIVVGFMEAAPVATRAPERYQFARVTDQTAVISPLNMLHLSWGRTEEELLQKLTNWGHSTDIDIEKTIGLWRATTLENYQQRRNFHPLHSRLWQALEVIDWPPKSLVSGHGSDDWIMWSTQDHRMVVRARKAGGVLMTFDTPSSAPKGTTT